ncbi:MAG: hypothetical protein P8I93_09380 [Crocinitomicaceae bacterium]|nr:hypothetical protein [Crocinitomicaceae bacterium]
MPVFGQTIPFSFSGNTINWDTKQNEYGVTIYFIQSQRTLSRVLSQQNGSFSIKAKINPEKPFELYFAKPGLITKKVLFYFNDKTKDSKGDPLKINGYSIVLPSQAKSLDYKKILKNNPNGNFEIKGLKSLEVELFSPKKGVDFSFLKDEYIAEFYWNGSSAELNEEKFNEMKERINKLLDEAKRIEQFTSYVNKGDNNFNKENYQNAIINYDSALVIKSDNEVIEKKKNAQEKLEKYNALEKMASQIKKLIKTADSLGVLVELDNAKSTYEKVLSLDNDNKYVKEKLNLINQKINENKNLKEYQEKFEQAKKIELDKKYDEAIAKYKECIVLIPDNKDKVDEEIKRILSIKKRLSIEKEAMDLIQVADKKMNGVSPDYTSAITEYKNAKKKLKSYPDSKVIKTANEKIEHAEDMQKSSAVEIYQKQIKKAQEAVEKGPAFYKTAKNILNSAPMKNKINEPESKMLLQKININESFFKKKKNVYKLITKGNHKKSLSGLSKLKSFANSNNNFISQSHIDMLVKSSDSITKIINTPKNITNNDNLDTIQPAKNSIQLEDLGTLIEDEKEGDFLNSTDLIKKKIIYDKIENDIDAIENEEIYKRNKGVFELTVNEDRINKIEESSKTKEVDLFLDYNNNLKERIKTQEEVEINTTKKNENIKELITENSNQLSKTTELIEVNTLNRIKEIIEILDSTEIANRKIAVFEDDANKKYSEKIYNNNLSKDSLVEFIIKEKLKKNAENLMILDSIHKRKDSISMQVLKIKPQANFLKNSNGEQYKIGVTEEVFKKGPKGMENQKITRRVIVDENYHGDVYIRFEEINRETTYTKNNNLISRNVWILETQNAKLVKN